MTKEELFKKYSIDESHAEWDNMKKEFKMIGKPKNCKIKAFVYCPMTGKSVYLMGCNYKVGDFMNSKITLDIGYMRRYLPKARDLFKQQLRDRGLISPKLKFRLEIK